MRRITLFDGFVVAVVVVAAANGASSDDEETDSVVDIEADDEGFSCNGCGGRS